MICSPPYRQLVIFTFTSECSCMSEHYKCYQCRLVVICHLMVNSPLVSMSYNWALLYCIIEALITPSVCIVWIEHMCNFLQWTQSWQVVGRFGLCAATVSVRYNTLHDDQSRWSCHWCRLFIRGAVNTRSADWNVTCVVESTWSRHFRCTF